MQTRIVATMAGIIFAAAAQAAPVRTILYTFGLGADPGGTLAMDEAGNLFGATPDGDYAGGVFELSPPASGQGAWTMNSLYTMTQFQGGFNPTGIILDKADNLYGTASHGGASGSGCGTVFELQKTNSGWTPKTLWTFQDVDFGGSLDDGCTPLAPLTMDNNGALYGNTISGGYPGSGTVFRLVPPQAGTSSWSESVIWRFDAKKDGQIPDSQMAIDPAGNLYGTSYSGGPGGAGTVWELTPPAAGHTAWTFTVLYAFNPKLCGQSTGPLTRDKAGNLYGTCQTGGPAKQGVVFELSPDAGSWSFKTIWAFNTPHSESGPTSGVALSPGGDLFGVDNRSFFVLHPPASGETNWTLHNLWIFDKEDSFEPINPVLLGKRGAVFGTTETGFGAGTVWELQP
jgi:uncharacterized repeat protein (TIGR03803 family)